MIVKRLRLRDFRNYGQLSIDLSENLNIIYGENAQGKTNILEAVFLCSTGRSHRTLKDSEMIKFGSDAAVVELVTERENFGECGIEIEIQRSGRKRILVNGVPQRRAGDLLGRFNCAIFSPEDLAIIKDEPQIRRRFLDMFISQIKPSYYFNLQRYLSVLRQRNALLRQARENPGLLDTINVWDSQLSEFGAKVMRERLYYVGQINGCAKTNHTRITGGSEELSVLYEPSLKLGDVLIYENGDATDMDEDTRRRIDTTINGLFLNALERGLRADAARMATQCGPHKDDIKCTIDGRDARLYGSQGQQRTAALALKMAQVDVMAAESGEIPVLLLDDVMSELDHNRRDNISSNMKKAQIIITGTDRYARSLSATGEEQSEAAYFLVDNGQISKD